MRNTSSIRTRLLQSVSSGTALISPGSALMTDEVFWSAGQCVCYNSSSCLFVAAWLTVYCAKETPSDLTKVLCPRVRSDGNQAWKGLGTSTRTRRPFPSWLLEILPQCAGDAKGERKKVYHQVGIGQDRSRCDGRRSLYIIYSIWVLFQRRGW